MKEQYDVLDRFMRVASNMSYCGFKSLIEYQEDITKQEYLQRIQENKFDCFANYQELGGESPAQLISSDQIRDSMEEEQLVDDDEKDDLLFTGDNLGLGKTFDKKTKRKMLGYC